MNLEQLESRVKTLSAELKGHLRREMETVAQTGLSLVVDRVSETGKDSQGSPFKPYTPEYEAYKRRAIGGISKESKKKRKERRTREASREKPVGRYRGFVDFTLSGQMLSSLGLIETTEGERGVHVIIGGRDEETRGKMVGNDNYRPGWFSLSKRERGLLVEQSKERFSRFIVQFLTS